MQKGPFSFTLIPATKFQPALTFLVRLGGWQTSTGYRSQEIRYEPLLSTDLQNWETAFNPIHNLIELPIPPAGFKYVTYLPDIEPTTKAFFSVTIDEQ